MFARYLLGDLFLHGIGGAKYDELGDEVSGRFFGFEPPGYLTLSMTLWLGLGRRPGRARPARGRRPRAPRPDLEPRPPPRRPRPTPRPPRWVEAKRRAVAGPVETHAQRLDRFREIRRCNEALQGLVAAAARLLGERARRLAGGSGATPSPGAANTPWSSTPGDGSARRSARALAGASGLSEAVEPDRDDRVADRVATVSEKKPRIRPLA